jgi:hypothetical protein
VLQDAQAVCKDNRALSRAEVRTMLVELKKEVPPKTFEEVIGKMNAWSVDTKFGEDHSGK